MKNHQLLIPIMQQIVNTFDFRLRPVKDPAMLSPPAVLTETFMLDFILSSSWKGPETLLSDFQRHALHCVRLLCGIDLWRLALPVEYYLIRRSSPSLGNFCPGLDRSVLWTDFCPAVLVYVFCDFGLFGRALSVFVSLSFQILHSAVTLSFSSWHCLSCLHWLLPFLFPTLLQMIPGLGTFTYKKQEELYISYISTLQAANVWSYMLTCKATISWWFHDVCVLFLVIDTQDIRTH